MLAEKRKRIEIDITIATEPKTAFGKELLRFREELGREYVSDEVSKLRLKKLYKVLIKSNGEVFERLAPRYGNREK